MPDRYTFHNYDTHGVVVDTQTGEATRYDLVSDAEAAARRLNDQNRRPAMASEVDTSAEAVERRAAWADGNADIFAVVALGRDGLREDQSHTDKLMERHKQHKEQAATLRALAAQRDAALTALRAREDEVGRLREALVRLCAWGRMTPSTPDERSAEQREGWGAFDQARAALATPAPEDAA